MPESSDVHGERNSHLQKSDAIRETILDMSLVLISAGTRCRSAGIRVERDGDFPLERSLGFSEKFVKRERSLLPPGVGAELHPEERLARLECLCGRVIRGELVGFEELCSRGGSFWSNDFCDTEGISPSVRDQMRQTCLEEGFQSIALVPCHPNHRTLGLLHVADTRRGLLSERMVAGLEETGKHFARLISLLRELKSAQSRLRDAESKLCSVLVVDDQEEVASLLGDILKAEKHRATIARSGREALEILSRQKIDVVLTDYNMPGMSGTELAGEIRRRWRPYAPPVILISGTYSEEVLSREEHSSDVAAFLAKPFSGESLLEAIHTVVLQQQR